MVDCILAVVSDWSVSHSVCLVSLRVLVCPANERFYGRSHPITLYEQFTVRGCRQHVVILQFIRTRLQTARGCYYVGFLQQSTQIPETKWSEISIDFVTDLHKSSRNRDRILVVVDKATRMVNLVPCSKGINAIDIARLL